MRMIPVIAIVPTLMPIMIMAVSGIMMILIIMTKILIIIL